MGMTIADAAYHTVHDYPGGAVALASRTGGNAAVLSHKVSPTCGTHHLSLDEAARIMDLTGDHRILVAMCRRLGYLDPIPAVAYEGIADDALLDLVTRMHAESGDVSRTLSTALADGRITQPECDDLAVQAQEAMTAIAALVDRVLGMVVESRTPALRQVR